MATSANYDQIAQWIYPVPKTFTVTGYKSDGATSDGKARKLCPHVLGYKRRRASSETPNHERVLCYELGGTDGCWRIYKVKHLVGLALSATPFEMGPDYSEDHSIPNVKFYVPVP